jgi:hypothetical protein
LAFELAFDPDKGPSVTIPVGCVASNTDLPSSGAVPPRGSGVPDFAEPGQFEAPCVWIPPSPGNLTVRAVVTYSVVLVIAGPGGTYSSPEPAYTWMSNPSTARVDNLRVVNIRPEG